MRYQPPTNWIKYDIGAVTSELVDAKAAVYSVKTVPYQRAWVELREPLGSKAPILPKGNWTKP